MKQNLHIKGAQSLSLTPRLQQAIQLLNMSCQELGEFVAAQVAENPLLILGDQNGDTFGENPSNPTSLGMGDDDGWLGSYSQETRKDFSHGDDYSPFEGKTEKSLTDILLDQLYVSFKEAEPRFVGEYIIYNLNENGFLELTSKEIAQSLGVKKALVDRVLGVLKSFEPVGICAQNLQDSFKVQLKEKGQLNDTLEKFIDHLHLLTEVSLSKIAQKINLTLEECQDYLGLIRGLNPKPAQGYDHLMGINITPEVFMVKNFQGEWEVSLNEDAQPNLTIDKNYHYELREKLKNHGDKHYLSERYGHAYWLTQALKQRAINLLLVAKAIVKYQQGFFEKGYEAFRPLTLKQVAKQIDVHESTVSRITNSKYMATPFGTLPLKFFFSAAISPLFDEGTLSAKRIQESMREIINAEPQDSPYSDDDLVSLLNNRGIAVARRTVTKYRKVMGVGSSVERKRGYELGKR